MKDPVDQEQNIEILRADTHMQHQEAADGGSKRDRQPATAGLGAVHRVKCIKLGKDRDV
jgi:hypothetical protein